MKLNKKAQFPTMAGWVLTIVFVVLGIGVLFLSSQHFKDYATQENYKNYYSIRGKRFLITYLRTPVKIEDEIITIADLIALNENKKYSSILKTKTKDIIELEPLIFSIEIIEDEDRLEFKGHFLCSTTLRSYYTYIPSINGDQIKIQLNICVEQYEIFSQYEKQ